ncbi:hypothetical protein [Herbiconiux sp. UC225_62]|uniref:hypothetical protein n=1 Tax=Herbiconiux sp. UC225_62 TaxID=3350168 RepID=UPI0036D2A823
MDELKKSPSRRIATAAVGFGGALAALVALSGCTTTAPSDADDRPTLSETRSPEPSPDPTAVAEALAAEDAKSLPMPQDDIQDWAARTVPNSDSESYFAGFSGWLSEHSSPRLNNTVTTAPAGRYTVSIACLGGGPLGVSVQQLDQSEVGATLRPCDGTVQTIDIETASEGISTVLTNPLTSDPAVFAVTFETAP